MNEESPLQQLEKLSNFLHGAHLVCDHENSSSTFHIAKHTLDEIIVQIKLNHNNHWIRCPQIKV
jgi:hypothetical protein